MSTQNDGADAPDASANQSLPGLVVRGGLGGSLMGLANLVPGISGGTMLLAAGVYPAFIKAVADVTTLRLTLRSLILLAAVAGAAVVAIVLLAGPVRDLVVERRWIMYSLFIGLTLGGAPLLARMARPWRRADVLLPALFGLGAMIAMAFVGPAGGGPSSSPVVATAMLVVAGVAGAAAMVLPGISGGYLLLLLGQYVVILGAVDQMKDAASARDMDAALSAMRVVIPVGIGVVVGVAGISNLVRWLLARYERPTLGVLLGLLVGAVVGLWPFQSGVQPADGATFRGDTVEVRDGVPWMVTAEREIEPADWPTAFFTPSAGQIAGSIALIGAGLAASLGIARLGQGKDAAKGGGDAPGA